MDSLTLEQWARSSNLNLALVFTDIVESTAIGKTLGDNSWIEHLAAHFHMGRHLAEVHHGFVVKVIGDAFMVAFHNSTGALEFSVEFAKSTGVDFIGIRIGIHSGQVRLMENDIYGLNVNKAARIQSSTPLEGISVSDSIKEDCVKAYGSNSPLVFSPSGSRIRNFEKDRVWRVKSRELYDSYKRSSAKRKQLLGIESDKPVVSTAHNTPVTENAVTSKLSTTLGSTLGNIDWKRILDKSS